MPGLLQQAQRLAQMAEVFSTAWESDEASFEANRLKAIQTRQGRGQALRLVKDGRLGLASSSRPDADEELLTKALEVASLGIEAGFRLPSFASYPSVEVYDPAARSVSVDDMAALGQALIDALRRGWPELQCEAEVSRSVSRVDLSNTEGGQATYQRSAFHVSVEGVLIRGTDMLFVGDSRSSCQPFTYPADLVADVRQQLEWARDTAPGLAPGAYPVVFTPRGVASAFFFPLITALNGQTVLQGASPLGGRLGQVAFDRRLTLEDNATLPLRPGSRPCDDEAVPSQRTPLIQEGVVANFLYDLETAQKAGAQSTASGNRTLDSLPSPGISNLVLAQGDATQEELISDIKDGLLVDILMGAGQGNILGGEFSGNVLLGYRVQKGKIVGRVKDTMVSGNVFQMLEAVAAIGSPYRWVGSSMLLPPIYCSHVNVASR